MSGADGAAAAETESYGFTIGTEPLVRVLAGLAARRPDDPCFTVDDETLTFAALDARSNALARVLADRGVGYGDFVTICLPNSAQNLVSVFAVLKLGATPNPISPRLTPREIGEIVALAGPRVVIGGPAEAVGQLPYLPEGFEPDPGVSSAPLEERVSPVMKAPTSGGSTGRPKLILFGTPAVVDLSSPPFGFPVETVMFNPGPLYHNAPLTNTLFGIAFGNHVVANTRFDAEQTLRLIATHRVTWAFLVPTMLHRIWRLPAEVRTAYDIGSLRRVTTSGGPLAPWLKTAWMDWIGDETLVEIYGTTEGVAITMITGQEARDHPGSVGRVAFGEMAVLDESGNPLPAGEVGEVFMRNNLGQSTFEYVGSEERRHGDWVGFGDLGHFDDDGYLYLADRSLDKIVTGGANVYPAEVESVLSEHPAVLSCVVVGLPDEDLGQRVHALVQTRGDVGEADLLAFVAARLVRYKVPRSVEFVDAPLRDDAGKARRSALAAERAGRGPHR